MSQLSKIHSNWDIFCKIVDNLGDIGVCWRLAKQLHVEHGLMIRLWIDDFSAAIKIIPQLNISLNQQVIDEITILKWHAEADFTNAADVVIETFACELPTAYVSAMVQKKSNWINLEYLSAESWVADFHAKPSPQANGLTRYFYFPGFTEGTGGLIRESIDYVRGECGVLKEIHLSNVNPEFVRWHDSLKISLFCYPNAPIQDLFAALQANKNKVIVYTPASGILLKVAGFFEKNSIEIGEKFSKNNLTVHVLPFLSQPDYDKLLSECDLNFVRGEDSWVRAIWAEKPFIWQPYFQEENTHLKKLDAFLDSFYANYNAKDKVFNMHACWAGQQISATIWRDYLNQISDITAYTLQQSQQLAKQPDLATKLVIFCNNIA
jgi:uncharacterized repeat protein (TIGR03837 family)